jgi:hypothetical protein
MKKPKDVVFSEMLFKDELMFRISQNVGPLLKQDISE